MSSEPMHFLVVEDDDDHADLIGLELASNSTYDRATDGEAALAYLRREGHHADRRRPDVILLDLKIPKLSGHELLRRIKADEDLRSIPVVVLTTSSANTDREEAYRNHANSYLVKPVDYEQFHQMIRDLQKYWGTWNQAATPRNPVG